MSTQRCRPTALTVVFHLCAARPYSTSKVSSDIHYMYSTEHVQNEWKNCCLYTVNVYIQPYLHWVCVYVDNETHTPLINQHLVANGTINTQLKFCMFTKDQPQECGPGWHTEYSNSGQMVWDRILNGGKIFHTCPYWPWDLPSLLYNEYWVLSQVNSS